MLRMFWGAILAMGTIASAARAADGVVAGFENGKVTLRVGSKEQTFDLKQVKLTGADGKPLKGAALRGALTKDAKLELIEKDGKVVELRAK
jgi:hypothetical protein